jgi:hypothetical protein
MCTHAWAYSLFLWCDVATFFEMSQNRLPVHITSQYRAGSGGYVLWRGTVLWSNVMVTFCIGGNSEHLRHPGHVLVIVWHAGMCANPTPSYHTLRNSRGGANDVFDELLRYELSIWKFDDVADATNQPQFIIWFHFAVASARDWSGKIDSTFVFWAKHPCDCFREGYLTHILRNEKWFPFNDTETGFPVVIIICADTLSNTSIHTTTHECTRSQRMMYKCRSFACEWLPD